MSKSLLRQRLRYLPALFLVVILSAACNKKTATAQPHTDTTANPLTYQNPVFNHDFPDPNLVDGNDGYFYAYSTNVDWRQDIPSGLFTTPVIRSKDLVKWELVGDAFTHKPAWKSDGGIWAPDASFHNNMYYLYYSYSTWGDPNPGIGVATSATPAGPFTDHGKLFLSKEIGVDNSIDPVFFEDGGKPYLVWGSFHGIYGVELSADGLQVKGEKFQIGGNNYEGSFIYKKDGYYYYFGSTGSCCEGAASTYQVNIARSTTFKGPYMDKAGKPLLENGGTVILQKDPGTDGFVGPGHNGDIVTDKAGQTWMIYHAYNKNRPDRRVLLLDKLNWADGWPVIDQGVPDTQPQPLPVFH